MSQELDLTLLGKYNPCLIYSFGVVQTDRQTSERERRAVWVIKEATSLWDSCYGSQVG